jgi:hypothetical protein
MLVPESLNEFKNFERGQYPQKSMNVGMNNLVKDIDSDDLYLLFNVIDATNQDLVSFEEFISYPQYEGMDSEDQEEVYQRGKEYYDLLIDFLEYDGSFNSYSDLNDHIENMKNSQRRYAYDYTPGGNNVGLVFSSIELPSADPALEAGEYLAESYQGFERGKDPKSSLDIGVQRIISTITSEDLELFDMYMGGEVEGRPWEREFRENYEDEKGNLENPEEYERDLKRVKQIHSALRGHVETGEFFDHKEKDLFNRYMEEGHPNKNYAYNAYPGGDGVLIIWSDIELPAAEEIDID